MLVEKCLPQAAQARNGHLFFSFSGLPFMGHGKHLEIRFALLEVFYETIDFFSSLICALNLYFAQKLHRKVKVAQKLPSAIRTFIRDRHNGA